MSDVAYTDPRPRWRRTLSAWRHRHFHDWVYLALGERWCGNINPPLDHKTCYATAKYGGKCEHVLAFANDGGEIAIGYPSSWSHILDERAFRRFALWYLWQWAFAGWFGLRRCIWYWALGRIVRQNRGAKQ